MITFSSSDIEKIIQSAICSFCNMAETYLNVSLKLLNTQSSS